MFSQRILTDETFNFRATVESHGWYMLPPFSYDREEGVLTRVHRLLDGRVIRLHIRATGNASRRSFLLVQSEGPVFPTDLAEIDATVSGMLCMSWHLDAFYALLRTMPGYDWAERERAGRMMRAPSVWEDLVKTLLTTNTTWAGTINMSTRLNALGEESDFGHAFPDAARIAAFTPEALADEVRLGYRAAYLHELAVRVASGDLDVEAWASPEMTSADLYRAITALKGFGDYAAASLMRLLGHHDRLSIDTICRDTFAECHNDGQRAPDSAIRAHYDAYGDWRGLVLWMDVIRDCEPGA